MAQAKSGCDGAGLLRAMPAHYGCGGANGLQEDISMTAWTRIGIAAVVLVNVAHGGWGLIWLLPSVLLIARRLVCYPGASHRCGQQD